MRELRQQFVGRSTLRAGRCHEYVGIEYDSHLALPSCLNQFGTGGSIGDRAVWGQCFHATPSTPTSGTGVVLMPLAEVVAIHVYGGVCPTWAVEALNHELDDL